MHQLNHSPCVQACFGHTEGTAGITGALLAVSALQKSMAPGIVNLMSMNPYVAAAIEDWGARQGMAAMLPRQTGPAIQDSRVCSIAVVVTRHNVDDAKKPNDISESPKSKVTKGI